ncbi:RNA-binding protein [Schizosaccharomyces cryophilus OY26]|uniref:RNA-binding protein n=1 Tax=Schizosaccharomyces cryophilus (strain OY26 / ATCC MYA-4695 / CBS 11777 / NBRC 106824 / NRRL Y48691) TaxID=653667 RepID=S9W525_SCHCR|nr:RNA-binding protein [Schizosaccharomyces cryophilus OY26]EPY53639.1 RNA-binding protein [Schizosaccharomyces cryophilus OY26]
MTSTRSEQGSIPEPSFEFSSNASYKQEYPSTNPARQDMSFDPSNGLHDHESPFESMGEDSSRWDSPSQDNSASIPMISEPMSHGKTTLWMGELEPWINEMFIQQAWASLGHNVIVKLIRNKFTGLNSGYCFIDFSTHEEAEAAMDYNGKPLPGTNRLFKLNWASGGGISNSSSSKAPEYSLFVGDLSPFVTERMLFSLFSSAYPSCKSVKIMMDPNTHNSRGYGFVRFTDENDQKRALSEMQGMLCGDRPIRVGMATPKSKAQVISPVGLMPVNLQPLSFYNPSQPMQQYSDTTNSTVFVGSLSKNVSENDLHALFQNFGDITYVKIPPGKGCGFVQFVSRQSAELAIAQLQGYPLGNSRIRLSWGRNQNSSLNPPPVVAYHSQVSPAPLFPTVGMPAQAPFSPFTAMAPSPLAMPAVAPMNLEVPMQSSSYLSEQAYVPSPSNPISPGAAISPVMSPFQP